MNTTFKYFVLVIYKGRQALTKQQQQQQQNTMISNRHDLLPERTKRSE